nr:MAG TPA: putative AtpZ [Caudoviricetes sp.]
MAVPYRLRTQSGGESVKERGNQKAVCHPTNKRCWM